MLALIKRNKKFLGLIILGLLIGLNIEALAQKGGGGPPKPPKVGCKGGPCPVPLDGGISLLVAAGIGLGGYKLFKTVKK